MSKKGRPLNTEVQFILDNITKMSVDEIATALDRTAEMVVGVIKAHTGAKPKEARPTELETRKNFRKSAEWQELRNQFTDSELSYFEARYTTWCEQFTAGGQDMTPSEQTQIFMLLKTEILLNRNLEEKQQILGDIKRCEKLRDSVYAKYPKGSSEDDLDDADRSLLRDFNEQLSTFRAGQSALIQLHIKLGDQHNEYMKALKATRDQRLKRIENHKVSFVDIVKDLMSEESRQREEEYMELMRIAAENERRRLSEFHTYADGNIDRPILSANTVQDDQSDNKSGNAP